MRELTADEVRNVSGSMDVGKVIEAGEVIGAVTVVTIAAGVSSLAWLPGLAVFAVVYGVGYGIGIVINHLTY